MAESKMNSTGIIIMVAIAILIGIILVQVIADQTVQKTQLTSKTDPISISSVRIAGGGINYTADYNIYLLANSYLSQAASKTPWKMELSDCAITTVRYYNQTGSLMSSSSDYTWAQDGNNGVGYLRPKNVLNLNSSNSNSTTIAYNYCPDNYISGWANTVLDMVPGFFVLGILIGGAFVIFYVLKREGIDIGF